MPEMGPVESESLRDCLRKGTVEAHDRLDQAVSALDLAKPPAMAAFLRFQYTARAPIEEWLAKHAPDLALPAMAPLIAGDLAALRHPLPTTAPFHFPTAAGALGIAWALAGSHLGNRAMLARLRKSDVEDIPVDFLADETMREAWKTLLPQLEAPAIRLEGAQAVTAATAVFRHFEQCLARTGILGERVAA